MATMKMAGNVGCILRYVAALFLLGIVVVEAPPMWILILAVGFVFMVLYNFNAVTQTLGQLRRRK